MAKNNGQPYYKMKIRIYNSNACKARVVLESWATEFDLEAGNYLDFIDEKVLDPNAYFQVDIKDSLIIVWPEWQTTNNINVFASNGKNIDW